MEHTHTLNYEHYDSLDELQANEREVVEAAKKAITTAYAPSTGFHVGAAARLESGRIISGSNQESIVGPVGVCAERNLLYHHQANYEGDHITTIAIASDPDNNECYPCGMCRQVLADSESRQGTPIRVIMTGHNSASVVNTSLDLLPFLFKLRNC